MTIHVKGTTARPETQAWLMVSLDKQIVSVLGNLGSRCGAQSLGAEVRKTWLRLGDGLEIIWKFVRWSFVGILARDDQDVSASYPVRVHLLLILLPLTSPK
jgi:hypothetical protein